MFKVNKLIQLALLAYVSTIFVVLAEEKKGRKDEFGGLPHLEEIPDEFPPEEGYDHIPPVSELQKEQLMEAEDLKSFDEKGNRLWAAAVPVNISGEVQFKYAYLPPPEEYNNSESVQKLRNHLAGKIDNKYHATYDMRLPNLIELSGEIYDLYMVDRTYGTFHGHNVTWVIIFCKKEDKKSFLFAEHLNNITESLQSKGTYKLAYVDVQMDPELQASFDVRAEPHVFVLDGDNGWVYSWDFFLHPETIEDWIVNKDYKNSTFKFKANPRKTVAQMKAFHDFHFWKFTFMLHIGVHLEMFVIKNLPALAAMSPFNKVFNHDGTDQFGLKQDALYRSFLIVFSVLLVFMTCCCTKMCRKCFCTRTKYVLRKKLKKS